MLSPGGAVHFGFYIFPGLDKGNYGVIEKTDNYENDRKGKSKYN